ncbi:MAG: hypothetical protein IJJ84_12680 [Kiritimatiellae bacterium]|nr:hypothetical protein [Kiritimatiellia bacterium]
MTTEDITSLFKGHGNVWVRKTVFCAVALFAGIALAAFDVRDFGAKGDGKFPVEGAKNLKVTRFPGQ